MVEEGKEKEEKQTERNKNEKADSSRDSHLVKEMIK